MHSKQVIKKNIKRKVPGQAIPAAHQAKAEKKLRVGKPILITSANKKGIKVRLIKNISASFKQPRNIYLSQYVVKTVHFFVGGYGHYFFRLVIGDDFYVQILKPVQLTVQVVSPVTV